MNIKEKESCLAIFLKGVELKTFQYLFFVAMYMKTLVFSFLKMSKSELMRSQIYILNINVQYEKYSLLTVLKNVLC